MQVGTTKDQGLYNKPSAAVHPGALASGTLPQYNTCVSLTLLPLYTLGKNSGTHYIRGCCELVYIFYVNCQHLLFMPPITVTVKMLLK